MPDGSRYSRPVTTVVDDNVERLPHLDRMTAAIRAVIDLVRGRGQPHGPGSPAHVPVTWTSDPSPRLEVDEDGWPQFRQWS